MKPIKSMLAFTVLLAFTNAKAQNLLLKKAPPLTLKTVLQAPQKKLRGKDLVGKVVVLEFWATWCTPCMANVPHLNSLSNHFADSNVVFISITDEAEDKIIPFLKKRKINTWIGIDSNSATFKNYQVTGMPFTFVIDTKGIIQYAGEPQDLNEMVIRKILAGNYQPEQIKIKEMETVLGWWGGGDDPVFTANFKTKCLWQQTIRPSVMGASGGGIGHSHSKGSMGITLLRQSLPSVISYIEELASEKRVINLSNVADTARWDIIFSRNKGYDRAKALREITLSVEQAFSITIKDTAVFITVLIPNYSSSSKIMNEKTINFDNQEMRTYHPVKEIFDIMESKLGQIIDYSSNAASDYIDLFPVLPAYYNMTGTEIKAWLEKEGVSFKEEQKMINMKVLHDNPL
ncbi:MAG: TlpA disulfide reductase family protein [Chitinophagales bacterium]